MNNKLKHILSAIAVCFFIFLAVSSDDDKKGKGNSNDSIGANEQVQEEEVSFKEVEWADGNTYTYDYTETLTQEDSAGNTTEITVYMSNKPEASDVVCDTKVCKWCGKEVSANDFSIEEYPNINLLRGQLDYTSMFGIVGSLLDGKRYLDLDNNKIRTEWRVHCDYPGPKGFCSLKCEHEYKNR